MDNLPRFSPNPHSMISSSDNEFQSVDYDNNDEKIGQGTYGKVFKSQYISGNNELKTVAVKKITINQLSDSCYPTSALREISILKNLHHENIIKILDIFLTEPKRNKKGNISIIYEYIENDLSTLMDNKVIFSIDSIKCIMYQILKGIEYLHSNYIIHRDLKTANILIKNDGIVKIADFGMARKIKMLPSLNKAYTTNVCTIWYRAPELLLKESIYRTEIDMWSIGCVFAELLINKPIFGIDKNDTVAELEAIIKIIGSPSDVDLERYRAINGDDYINSVLPKEVYTNNLRKYIDDNRTEKINDESFSFLNKLLKFNPKQRYTIDEALKDPFFKDIKYLQNKKVLENEINNKIKGGNYTKIVDKGQNNNNYDEKLDMIIGEQKFNSKMYYNRDSIKKGRLIEKRNIVVNDEEDDNIDINDINYIIGRNKQNNNDIQLENKLKTIFEDD
jgi:cell division cycle 2-like protein